MKIVCLSVLGLFFLFTVQAQEEKKIADQAYLISRMVQRYHVLPKELNTEFSAIFFDEFISTINEGNIILLKSDIDSLNTYKKNLSEEIKNKQTHFLKLTATLFRKRFQQVDSLVNLFAEKPFNLMLKEELTELENKTPPVDIAAQKIKLYKWLKLKILNDLAEQLDIDEATVIDSVLKQLPVLEPALRKKAINSFKRSVKRIIENPNGVTDAIGKIYCKVLATCFDPHTNFLPPNERELLENELGKSIPKFGFSLDEEEGSTSIGDLLPGSAAYKSGQLNVGDKIEKIKWNETAPVDVSEADLEEINEILRSGGQDKLTLTVRKPDGTTRQVALEKQLIDEDLEEEKVKGYILSGDKKIGFISLPDFYTDWEDKNNSINGCANDIAKEIIRLKKENIEGLILDLRFNGGGSMQEAIDLAGIFIDAGPVGQLKTKEEKIITLKDGNRGTVYDGPLAILVNAYSASASELVAGTLQDYKRAVIIGSPTFGKGTAQVVMPLDTTRDFSKPLSLKEKTNSIKLTVEHLYRVNGLTVQAKGVTPDILLPDFFQATGKREADELFVLKPNNISANKYWQPLEMWRPLITLKKYAEQIRDTLGYFHLLNQYIQYYQSIEDNKNIPLYLPALIEQQQTLSRLTSQLDSARLSYKSIFSVKDPEKKKQGIDGSGFFMSEIWKKNLSTDPFIDITYRILALPPEN